MISRARAKKDRKTNPHIFVSRRSRPATEPAFRRASARRNLLALLTQSDWQRWQHRRQSGNWQIGCSVKWDSAAPGVVRLTPTPKRCAMQILVWNCDSSWWKIKEFVFLHPVKRDGSQLASSACKNVGLSLCMRWCLTSCFQFLKWSGLGKYKAC